MPSSNLPANASSSAQNETAKVLADAPSSMNETAEAAVASSSAMNEQTPNMAVASFSPEMNELMADVAVEMESPPPPGPRNPPAVP